MSKRVLHIVTNVDHYENSDHPTGLWLSELTHAWHVFEQHGYSQTIVSPKGGNVPLEPRSLTWMNLDSSGKAWKGSEEKMKLLEDTQSPESVNPDDFDAIYLTGGHAVMYDFLDSGPLKKLIADMWDRGKVVSSVCHGYCGLLNVKLADGSYLIAGRKMTGFSWIEEGLAGVSKQVPYNAEELCKERGALYDKALLPFTSHAVVDGRLVTGQNPQSAKETADKIVKVLESQPAMQ